jgi:hypothetical protein
MPLGARGHYIIKSTAFPSLEYRPGSVMDRAAMVLAGLVWLEVPVVRLLTVRFTRGMPCLWCGLLARGAPLLAGALLGSLPQGAGG